ncbi:MAG: nitrite/sulfite reductase, partial [Verrucomicrobia bacterium]|nr:nitrite/sulfite reductase [Verrucomicrobiota bacterium]
RGFEMYVGGGLGAVPYAAKLFDEFVPEDEIFPLTQAICRIYARLGQKKNRARARIKFLVDKLGIEKFHELVMEERKVLPQDDVWTSYLQELPAYGEKPLKPGADLKTGVEDANFETWRATNIYRQKQAGYVTVTIKLPLGDATSWQMRQLADIARRYVGDHVRTTVEQNIVFRWVVETDLPALYGDLKQIGLGAVGAGTIVDIVSCPGTDTCKLGIASSRGLAAELHKRLTSRFLQMDEALQDLRIKISGCFNSCSQHHLADLGFYGVSRNKGGTTVPHFRVVLGGQWQENGGSYGLAIGVVPSKRIPDFIDRITVMYLQERDKGEHFREFVQRIGKKELKKVVDEFTKVPPYELDRSYYSDWGDPREFTLSDLGVGECAGEIVSMIDFDLQAAERLYFEAQLAFDEEDFQKADETSYGAMLEAARGLVHTQLQDISHDPDLIIKEFRQRFFDTGLFQDKYAGGKFAAYLFHRHENKQRDFSHDQARYLLEETQLFIEAAHACNARLLEQASAAARALSDKLKSPVST